ncbi:MAG TPA: uracil phosphoribosyltransferase [Flavobacteriaceae bacterium]|nr:uracil phosphoribosyltransferase [Flavobacteriaceae bacterium]
MEIFHLLDQNTIANKFVAQLRDVNIQKDSMRFRRNIERIGEILGYELSKTLNYKPEAIVSPLGTATINHPSDELVICSILRAGIPLHMGLLNYFDQAQNSFISAYRHHPNQDEKFEIKVEYLASPSIDGKILILADPMLATGQSFVNVYKAIKKVGNPKEIHIVSVIAAQEGIDYLASELPANTKMWVGTIDQKLDKYGYIVPGLGDAGDLCFGEKMSS